MNPVSLLAYVPVLHRGYLDFFARHPGGRIFLMGDALTARFPHLRKDVRSVSPDDMALALSAVCAPRTVLVASASDLDAFVDRRETIVMPDEEECRDLAATSLSGCSVSFDPVFLRWDRTRILAQETVEGVRTVPLEGLAAVMLTLAEEESRRAANWWRQVGAVIARDDVVLLTGHNVQVPHDRIAAYEGDARSFFSRGLHMELTTDEHAEALLIAEAAKQGEPLEAADLYVTTFPCPPCAKLVARSGIRRCFFTGGYAMLDGRRVLEDAGVELIHVLSPQSA